MLKLSVNIFLVHCCLPLLLLLVFLWFSCCAVVFVRILSKYNDSSVFTARQLIDAMTTVWDSELGNITQLLKDEGQYENTLIIMTADNGGPLPSANNYPLRGGKFENWEGGVRTVAAVGGGFLPQKMRGTTNNGYIHIADWYATVCFLAGVDPTDQKAKAAGLPPIDSLNMWPLVSGQNMTSPRTIIPLGTPGSHPMVVGDSPEVTVRGTAGALIVGDYKIIVGTVCNSVWGGLYYPNATTKPPEDCLDCGKGCLYNIIEDETEHNNLNETQPDKLEKMLQLFKQHVLDTAWNHTLVEPQYSTKAYDKLMNQQALKNGGYWGPAQP
eukprot:m.191866 g.191866  ORF g.191866 m.191866 type:complete len:326 (-) comp25724_c0_seq10:103-1080(-)